MAVYCPVMNDVVDELVHDLMTKNSIAYVRKEDSCLDAYDGTDTLVFQIPRLGVVVFFDENGAQVKVWLWSKNETQYYKGTKGMEYKYRTDFGSGQTLYFKGSKGHERLVMGVREEGEIHFFEGDAGAERKVRTRYRNGEIAFFDGSGVHACLQRIEFPDGEQQFFEGSYLEERKVRTQLVCGKQMFYLGDRGEERVWKATHKDCMALYHGPKDMECVTSIFLDDVLVLYEGGKGNEFLTFVLTSDNSLESYVGCKGEERKVRIDYPDGSYDILDGEKGCEYVVGRFDESGDMLRDTGHERMHQFACRHAASMDIDSEVGGLNVHAIELIHSEEREKMTLASRRQKRAEKKKRRTRRQSQLDVASVHRSDGLEETETHGTALCFLKQDDDVAQTSVTLDAPHVQDDDGCVICLEASRTHVVVPCGHLCLCERCAVVKECPLCRASAQMVMKVFA